MDKETLIILTVKLDKNGFGVNKKEVEATITPSGYKFPKGSGNGYKLINKSKIGVLFTNLLPRHNYFSRSVYCVKGQEAEIELSAMRLLESEFMQVKKEVDEVETAINQLPPTP